MSYLDTLPRRVKITIAISSTLITIAVVTLAIILSYPFWIQNDACILGPNEIPAVCE